MRILTLILLLGGAAAAEESKPADDDDGAIIKRCLAWVKYRDAKCTFPQAFTDVGETGKDKMERGCRLEETARRAHELEQLRDWRRKR